MALSAGWVATFQQAGFEGTGESAEKMAKFLLDNGYVSCFGMGRKSWAYACRFRSWAGLRLADHPREWPQSDVCTEEELGFIQGLIVNAPRHKRRSRSASRQERCPSGVCRNADTRLSLMFEGHRSCPSMLSP